MTIVCATHLSASSAAAATVAAQLAHATGERLILATVLSGHGLGALAVADGIDQERARLSDAGLDVEVALLHGKLVRSLERLCGDSGARLLVVGDRPRDSVFSTPAERLAWTASLPLLVVRGDAPFQAWRRGEAPLRVLLGSDSARLEPAVTTWLTWLAGTGPLDLLAAHVWDPGADDEVERSARAEVRLRTLRASLLALPLPVGSRAEVEVGPGGLAEVLPRLVAREPTDLLVVGTQPTTGLLARRSSLAHDLLRRVSTSVALVPVGEAELVEPVPRASHTSPRSMRELLRRSSEH